MWKSQTRFTSLFMVLEFAGSILLHMHVSKTFVASAFNLSVVTICNVSSHGVQVVFKLNTAKHCVLCYRASSQFLY